MKRSDLKELGIEEKEIVDKIMDLYGAGVNEVKIELTKLQETVTEKDKSITELNEQIKSFDGKDTTLKELQEKVSNYEKAETDRVESEKQAKVESELKQRFQTLVGENKFTPADIETGRFNAFKSALADEKYKGKGDSDVFADITKEMDCFENPQQQKIPMPGGGQSTPGANDLARTREIMGLPNK